MHIHDDLSLAAVVDAAALDWVPSPSAGVERRLLFRTGGEKAHATSIVRYAPGSRFAQHSHPGGEEFLVLEGTFQDERGDYPAGSYVRNPPRSSHAPASAGGCTIFVRLRQFHDDDTVALVRPPGGAQPLLFADANERVYLQRWAAGEPFCIDNARGLELLVVSGALVSADGRAMAQWCWARWPAGAAFAGVAGADGLQLWFKQGAAFLA